MSITDILEKLQNLDLYVIDSRGNEYVTPGGDWIKNDDLAPIIRDLKYELKKLHLAKKTTSKVHLASNDFNIQVEIFLKYCQELINDNYKTNYPGSEIPVLNMSVGGKYVKFVECQGNSKTGSAFAFIDKSTGDILKAATWAAPAKGARGNIFDEVTWKRMTAYGPPYIRG